MLAQRELALASVALLASVVGLAVAASREARADDPALPKAVPAPGGGWYTALAASGGKSFAQRRTACGHVVGARTLGVAHQALPCDVKIFISYNAREVLTQVIARGPYVPGREFELSPALADVLGLEGTQPIRWRYAA